MALQPSFAYITKSNQLVGSVVEPANTLVACDASQRNAFIAASQGLGLDLYAGFDGSALGLTNMAGVVMTLTSTTAITLDLTNLVAATGVVVAGQGTFANSFATWSHILVQNIGTGSKPVAISPGASNPIRNQLGGTSPTHTLQTTDVLHWVAGAGLAVDSTHKTVTFTPTSGGSLLIWIGGS